MPEIGSQSTQQELRDKAIYFLDCLIYISSGFECASFFNNKLNNLKHVKYIKQALHTLLSIQVVNTLFCVLTLIIIPYITKNILFSSDYISIFLPGSALDGYLFEKIDFTSINNLSMSINVSSRNAALLIPLIFMLIADKVTKTSISLQENREASLFSKISNSCISKIRLFYTSTFWISIIYLLCSGSRIGILMGYLSSAVLLARMHNPIGNTIGPKKTITKNSGTENKTWDLKSIITNYFFILIILFAPYSTFFPLSCREGITYNTIFLNSTIPITHEINEITSALTNRTAKPVKTPKQCDENTYTHIPNAIDGQRNVGKQPLVIGFSEFSSSSFQNRLELYSKNRPSKESQVHDILSILRMQVLTIPLILILVFAYGIIMSAYLFKSLSKKIRPMSTSTFNIIDKNIVAFTGLIYFSFNSVVFPATSLAFGFMYFLPFIRATRGLLLRLLR